MLLHRWTLALALALAPGVARAAETGTFEISIAGLNAGTLTYAGVEENGRYSAKGSVRASPLARVVMDVDIDTTAKGQVTGNAYRPSYFEATEVKDGDTTTFVQRYANGVPSVTRTPAKKKKNKHAADPAQQAGTLDSMTTAFAMLRDRPRDQACALDIELFDGERVSGIRYGAAEPLKDGGILCHGEYRRLDGFKPKEMKEKDMWPFTVIYEPAGEMLRVAEVVVPTNFGKVRMVRR